MSLDQPDFSSWRNLIHGIRKYTGSSSYIKKKLVYWFSQNCITANLYPYGSGPVNNIFKAIAEILKCIMPESSNQKFISILKMQQNEKGKNKYFENVL